MRNKAGILTALAFLTAAGLSFLMALAVGLALESRSQRHVQRALNNTGLTWVEASADGLMVSLKGTAPSEALRYRASIVAGRVVGASRIIDEMDVTPSKPLTAPRFSLELLRNDDGVSVIGLAPAAWDASDFLAAAKRLADEDLTNMIETADFTVPPAWDEAVTFGLEALRLLPRSKISIAADGVKVDAIADSTDQKHALETSLARSIPRLVPVNVQISAPRPVITPFTLRFVLENGAARFDACSADTERARMRITSAGRRAGVPGAPVCVLGLGVPSPRWADAAEALIAAMKELGAGSVTMSDVDVTLIAEHSVAQADFDRVVGELTAKLPDVFSLKATLTPKPEAEGIEGPVQFTATLNTDGRLELRGRLSDERMRDIVDAFAKARFGAQNVYVAPRLDDQLPPTWGTRVLAGLSALAEISHGSVLVEPEAIAVRGVTGNTGARAEIARLLADRLGQGARYRVDVTYDERLDPNRGLPSPEQCLARTVAVLSERQITFAPNADEVVGEAARVVSTLAEELEDCAGAPLEIGGHTDSQGRAESNLALSQRRADAVLNGLAQRGIDVSAMTAKGYGAAEPIADNATEEGRIANRRIQFKLLPVAEAAETEDQAAEGAAPAEPISSIRPPGRPESFAEIPSTTPPPPPEPETAAPEEADPAAATTGSEADASETDAAQGETPSTDAPSPDEAMTGSGDETFPDLAEGEEPMGDAGDLEVGPDGEPVIDPAQLTAPLDEDELSAEPETGSTPPAVPVTETPDVGDGPAALQADPETDAAEAQPTAETTTEATAPEASAPAAAAPVEAAPAAAPTDPAGEASGAPSGGEAPPSTPPANAPPSSAAVDAPPAEPAPAPEPEPAAQPAPAAPAALPLPAGWDFAPAVPDLRPLPRPKEFAR